MGMNLNINIDFMVRVLWVDNACTVKTLRMRGITRKVLKSESSLGTDYKESRTSNHSA